jgi:hypothetical protein
MKITKVEWRNFFSYGNRKQTLEFPDSHSLIQVVGGNGNGKCLHPDTVLKIRVSDETKNKIENFMKR